MTNKCFNGYNENDEITKENAWIYNEYFLSIISSNIFCKPLSLRSKSLLFPSHNIYINSIYYN